MTTFRYKKARKSVKILFFHGFLAKRSPKAAFYGSFCRMPAQRNGILPRPAKCSFFSSAEYLAKRRNILQPREACTSKIIPAFPRGDFFFGYNPKLYRLRTSALFIGLPATRWLFAARTSQQHQSLFARVFTRILKAGLIDCYDVLFFKRDPCVFQPFFPHGVFSHLLKFGTVDYAHL